MIKFSYEMTQEERELHIQKLGRKRAYNKLNEKMKYIYKELKVTNNV